MTADLITIGWSERMEVAFRRMRGAGVRHLPVHDDAGEIVGMLSDRDVQRAMISTIDPGWVSSTENVEFDPATRVRDYMTWPALSVDSACELREVAQRMIDEKVSSMLVKSGARAVGIVTAEDLLKVLVEVLGIAGAPPRLVLADLLARSSRRLTDSLI